MGETLHNNQLGITIKNLRATQKMTQSHMAKKSNLDQSYISLLEAGKRDPTLNTLYKLSKALNIDIVELMYQINSCVI